MSRAKRRFSAWRAAGTALAWLIAIVPMRARFTTACRLARCLAPLIWLIPQQRTRLLWQLRHQLIHEDRGQDTALFLLLEFLSRWGIELEPRLQLHGQEILERALGESGGMMIVGPHAMLGALIFWILEQHAHPCIALATGNPRTPCSGTPLRVLPVSKLQLVRALAELRAGATLVACGTSTDPVERLIRHLPQCRLPINLGLLNVASSCGARVFFVAGYLSTRCEIALHFGQPEPGATQVEEYARDLARFTQQFLEARDGPYQPLPSQPSVHASGVDPTH